MPIRRLRFLLCRWGTRRAQGPRCRGTGPWTTVGWSASTTQRGELAQEEGPRPLPAIGLAGARSRLAFEHVRSSLHRLDMARELISGGCSELELSAPALIFSLLIRPV